MVSRIDQGEHHEQLACIVAKPEVIGGMLEAQRDIVSTQIVLLDGIKTAVFWSFVAAGVALATNGLVLWAVLR